MSYTVYTVGYGGRSIEEFIDLLRSLGVEVLVDVRRWNKSVKNPDYSGSSLLTILREIGVEYHWVPELGGYRRFGVDISDYGIASCFEAEGFRAYATYITRNPGVKPILEWLVELAKSKKVVIMCAEKLPWRCHRKIISDYLVARGFRVLHVIDRDYLVEHRLSECAVVKNGELDYT